MKNGLQVTLLAATVVGVSACGGSGGSSDTVERYGAPKIYNVTKKNVSFDRSSTIKFGQRIVGQIHDGELEIDFANFPKGVSHGELVADANVTNKKTGETAHLQKTDKFYLYNQWYSTAFNLHATHEGRPDVVTHLIGTPTLSDAIPTEGRATYTGEAYDDTQKGQFEYQVDFGKRTGEGSITGLGDRLTLVKAKMADVNKTNFGKVYSLSGIDIISEPEKNYTTFTAGITDSSGQGVGGYDLALFGPNANEVTGDAFVRKSQDDEVRVFVMGGTRGDIQK